jgi:hypothetical protein
MLTTEQALAIAAPRQRAGLVRAAEFGDALGSPVRFLCRRGPAGVEFEAIMIGPARTCATVSARGELTWQAGRRPGGPRWERAAAGTPTAVAAPPAEPATVIAAVAPPAEPATVIAAVAPPAEPATVIAAASCALTRR